MGRAVDPVDDVLYVASQTSLFRAQVVEGSPGEGVLYHNPRDQTVGPRQLSSDFRSSSLHMGVSRPSI
jgi:hypothetical protein